MTERLTLVGAHQRAFRQPSFMRTNEYIHAVLFSHDLYSLELEMGPNCNLSCGPCSANCGPHRKGLPDPKTVEKAIGDGLVSGVISGCTLTDGEALREENREVMRVVARTSEYLPIHIMTNGVFAGSLESAVDWFNFLKKSGMDFSDKNRHRHQLCVSFGSSYHVSSANYANIGRALRKVFPKVDPGKVLTYRLLNMEDIKDNQRRGNEMDDIIEEVFGKIRRTKHHIRSGENSKSLLFLETGTPITIEYQKSKPFGRGANLKFLKEIYPLIEFKPENMFFESHQGDSVNVFYNGDVTFDCCGEERARRKSSYGNVNENHLGGIIWKIRSDVFFQGFKLGGTPFVYHIARKVKPDFRVIGRYEDEVSAAIFGNSSIIGEVRDYLSRRGVVDCYKKFINGQDLRVWNRQGK